MNPDIAVDPELIRSHARLVDDVAAMFDEARAGVGQILTGHDAFGQLCSPLLVGLLDGHQQSMLDKLHTAVSATQALADKLRDTATGLECADDNAAVRLGGAR